MKFVPFHDNVFVKRDEPIEKKSPGGVYLPKSEHQIPDTAEVLAVGPGRVLDDGTTVKPSVKPGDKILIGRHSGVDVNWDLERMTVVAWADVLGIVKPDKITKKRKLSSKNS